MAKGPVALRPTNNDDIDAALELVVSLAEQNVIDRRDNPREYRRQMLAVKIVKETFGIHDW